MTLTYVYTMQDVLAWVNFEFSLYFVYIYSHSFIQLSDLKQTTTRRKNDGRTKNERTSKQITKNEKYLKQADGKITVLSVDGDDEAVKLCSLLCCLRLVHDINFLFVFFQCIRVGADLKCHRIARANVTNYFIRRATCIVQPDNFVHHIGIDHKYFSLDA